MTGRADHLELGDWNAVCFECGRKRKASTMKLHWQNYYVCPEHWEPRHPQDFVRAIPEVITPPWTQPPSEKYRYTCSPNGMTAIAGYGVAGCMVAAYISPLFDSTVA